MGKRWPKGVLFGPFQGGKARRLCVACRRPIYYGDRCEGCKRDLTARRRRKPR